MTENKRYEFDEMNGGGYVVGYSERMSDDISVIFTRLCEVPTKTQAEQVCNELKGLQKENEQLKTQIKIFEMFLNENNLDIDWEIFCTVDECKKDSDDYGCKECEYLGDIE